MTTFDLTYLTNLKGWVGQRDFSLDRIRLVAKYFDNPQDAFRSIHVAGTNGKGSTSKALSSIIQAAGLKSGLYTSPHLSKINERIVIGEQEISNELLFRYSNQIKEALEELNVELSLFEVLTLISFLVFRDSGVDYAVIEAGLGGRLDATNIISKPDISIITSIGLDHQDVLGTTLEQIAKEKAGIIKKDAWLIIGEMHASAREEILNKASQVKQVFEFKRDFKALGVDLNFDSGYQNFNYLDSSARLLSLQTSMLGMHQLNNLSLAIKAALLLGISDADIQQGIKNTFWPARLESIVVSGKKILIDSAHNTAGLNSVIDFCQEVNFRPDVIIFGALATKEWKEMLSLIPFKIKRWFIIEAESSMAVSSKEIADFISMHELGEAECFGQDFLGLFSRIKDLSQNTNVLALGSIYIVGKLRQLIINKFS